MTARYPALKRGNPYQHTWSFGFAEGSLADCHAIWILKAKFSDADTAAKLIAVTAGIFADYPGLVAALPGAIEGGIALAAGVAPSTGVFTWNIPAEKTAPLPTFPLLAGLQILKPDGAPYEFEHDVLDHEFRVYGDVVGVATYV